MNEYNLKFTAKVDKGWWIYAQESSPDGPIPTSFNYDSGAHYSLVGKTKESAKKQKEGKEPLFDNVMVKKYGENVVFTQKVKVSDYSKPITGYVEFMSCDNKQCTPPTDYEINLSIVRPTTEKATDKAQQPAAPKKVTPTAEATPPTKIDTKTNTANNKATTSSTKSTTKAAQPAQTEKPVQAEVKQSGILTPVKWDFEIKDAGNGEYDLVWTANIDKGWSIYSQNSSAEGPVPTSFNFDEGKGYTKLGAVAETGNLKTGKEPLFDNVIVSKFKGGTPAVFTQRVKASNPNEAITGYLEFMTCDDGRCLPPTEVDFRAIPASMTALSGDAAIAANSAAKQNALPAPEAQSDARDESGLYPSFAALDLNNPVSDCGTENVTDLGGKSMFRIFILGFLGGLAALLTPCVFPMIPLTVSFFTKNSENKSKGVANATTYGFFIFLIYVLFSIPFHLMDSISPDILNEISTNVPLNIFFFVILIVFAISFFGYFELTLPQSWSNKASSAEGSGGLLGIFFMAVTLALVSFSCTGPILGALLAGSLSNDGGAMQMTAGFGGFGLALALPFTLFALFPGWLNSLPKSGGWLTSVKVVLGFLELALALKFLSNADLAMKAGILKYELFMGLWIVIFLGLAAYLFGWFSFKSYDKVVGKLPPLRLGMGILSVAFSIYLATGFMYSEKAGTYDSLSLLSGLAPPACYSWVYHCDCPQNLTCFKDLDDGLEYAKKVGKPIMIDFTGHNCVNCRKMEEHVWPVSRVYKPLSDDYVIVSLYVDEKIALPEDQQITVNTKVGGTRKLRNVGNKWAHLQTEKFNINTQPYYVLMAPDGKLLNNPVGYTPDETEYAEFLECGLENYKKYTGK